MAENESDDLDHQQVAELIHENVSLDDELTESELDHSQVVSDIDFRIDRLIKERQGQRRMLLGFVMGLTTKSFYLLVGAVVFQGLVRLFIHDFEIINTTVFNILAVSVFGQVIGVIYAIVRSLWDDSKYLEKI